MCIPPLSLAKRLLISRWPNADPLPFTFFLLIFDLPDSHLLCTAKLPRSAVTIDVRHHVLLPLLSSCTVFSFPLRFFFISLLLPTQRPLLYIKFTALSASVTHLFDCSLATHVRPNVARRLSLSG